MALVAVDAVKPPRKAHPAKQLLRPGMLACGLLVAMMPAHGHLDAEPQQEPEEPLQGNTPGALSGSLATVHGVVRNGASGESLARALVRINGDAMTGTLTDENGRFEIAGVPVGPQELQVIKPGFLDQDASAEALQENARSYGHNVMVATEMGDVVFTMRPVNSIRGQIELSTGDPAQGVQVTLLRRTVQDGRVVWEAASNAKTNSQGFYRFGGLADGSYALYTEPSMDSESATDLVEAGHGGNVARGGYASQFYPDARDLAGAAKIKLAGGDQAQANFSLTLEPFRSVMASIVLPTGRQSAVLPSQAGPNLSVLVMDGQGHQLAYSAQYDEATHTLQAFLPDGNYSLLVTQTAAASGVVPILSRNTASAAGAQTMTGQVDFSVAGRPVSNLRIPLSPVRSSPVQVTVTRAAAQTSQPRDSGVFITLSQTGGWISDGMVSSYAEGSSAGSLGTNSTPPGSYWAHTAVAQKGLCVASLTSGGVDLAREPLALGISGPAAPLTLVLRDDCAGLTLSLPGSFGIAMPGLEPFFVVNVVPDVATTEDVVPLTLRPSTGGRVTMSGLLPGNYHVYAFDHPVALEYRNPEALAGLHGQAVTLSPGETNDVVVEVGQH